MLHTETVVIDVSSDKYDNFLRCLIKRETVLFEPLPILFEKPLKRVPKSPDSQTIDDGIRSGDQGREEEGRDLKVQAEVRVLVPDLCPQN